MKLEAKCQKHWDKIGISNLETLQTYIKGIFRKHDHQEKILIDLYKMVIPDWDRIKKIRGYPEAGNALWKFICHLFIEFDQKKHPGCMAGGIWMNTGFSVNSSLSCWEISFKNCQVVMN